MFSHNFVILHRKQFNYGHENIFRVTSMETLSVLSGHTRIIPAQIPNWQQPLIKFFALFERKDKFKRINEVSAPNGLFDFTVEVIPTAIDNKTEEEITIYKITTFGFSEVVSKPVIKTVPKMPISLSMPIKNNKHDLNILKKKVDSCIAQALS